MAQSLSNPWCWRCFLTGVISVTQTGGAQGGQEDVTLNAGMGLAPGTHSIGLAKVHLFFFP